MANPFLEESGITHPNLGGAQVMDAGWEVFNPAYWWQKGSDWEHGTDHAKEYEIPWKFWEKDEPNNFYTAPESDYTYEDFKKDEWRRGNANLQYNRAQINMNESRVRQQERDMYNQFLKEGRKPLREPDGVLWPQYNAIPFDPDVHDQFPNFAPGVDWLHQQTYPNIQEPETIEAKINLQDIFRKYPGIDLWRLIQNLDARGIEYANRGGIIGLL